MKLLTFIFLELITTIVVISNPVVQIKNGTLEGIFMESRKGRKIAAFMGIPYAVPPLGDLRFEPPRPALSWSNVLIAKNHSNICTQRDYYVQQTEVVGDEDCLYLNVYTHKNIISHETKGKAKNNYPVMIWIHAGGFFTGTGNSDITSPKFLLDHNVILVTINYRLGPLGFLSTGDLIIPGNQGLKDQAQAIRWVHENIAKFGGDPNKVTLFGESAGGVSSHYHMLSPLSRGLFHRGISQSGTVLCPWAFNTPEKAKKNAEKLAKLLECPTDNSKQLLNCLRKKSAIDIIATDDKFDVFDYCPIVPFRPVIEPEHSGAFLTEEPAVLIKNGKIMDIPWLSGITSDEGAFRASRLFGLKNGELLRQFEENFEKIGPISALCDDNYSEQSLKKISKSLKKFYFNNRSLHESSQDLMNMYTDAWILFANYNSLSEQLKYFSSPMYFYYFAYKGSTTLSVLFGDNINDYGVCHGDELQYLFPFAEQLFPNTPLNKEDHRMIHLMTSLWFNFANSGNPTPEITEDIKTKWEPIKTNSLEYFHIKNSKDIFMEKNLCSKRMEFWKNLTTITNDFNNNESLKDEL